MRLLLLLAATLAAACVLLTPSTHAQLTYHSTAEIDTLFDNLATNVCPLVMRRFSVGTSVNGRELYGVRISKDVAMLEHEITLPAVRLAANMHGDETVGRELLVGLAEHLCSQYTSDPVVTWLVDNTLIYIIPSLNPDGYEADTRANANGIDLNRDYPSRFADDSGDTVDGRQPETRAMMLWSRARHIALAANFHGGAVVASYPWDSSTDGSDTEARTADDELYRRIAKAYADNSPPMLTSPTFAGGITNGAAWYSLLGSLQDWSVQFLGVPEITLEVSDIKHPAESSLPGFWSSNYLAILEYIFQVHIAATGRVLNPSGMPVQDAVCAVAGHELGLHTTVNTHTGRFWRVLPPGSYDITCSAPGKTSVTRSVTVHDASIATPPTDVHKAHAHAEFTLTDAAQEPAEPSFADVSDSKVELFVGLFFFFQLLIAVFAVAIFVTYRLTSRQIPLNHA